MAKVALLTHNNLNGGAAVAVSRLARGLTINLPQNAEFDFTLLAAIINEKDLSVPQKQISGSENYASRIARDFLSKTIIKAWVYLHKTRNLC